ncbi:hypothetical protein [Maribacter stanieri]|uniref:hypothetical protein n=1 Tax=Maribacter stanieri TaxID=440514 RepID=UPI0030DC2BFF|tara:strand:+ start:1785 stop:2795 length:1011 start_codon:yes stop_codon:yes gene_type:complete
MLWTKIFISIIAVGISLVEFWEFRKKNKNKKWQKLKKPIIIISSLVLLLLNVWDEISDKNESYKDEEKRNLQIIKDSIRVSNIISNLNIAITKIDTTALEINKSSINLAKVDSSISLVNKGLFIQGNRLNEIINESEEVNKNLTGGDSYIKFYLIKNRRNKTIKLACGLRGNYAMHNIFIRINSSSFIDQSYFKPIILEPLIKGNGVFGKFTIEFSNFAEVNSPYTLAIFNENELKEDLSFGFWTSSSNGTTFQKIEWKNHKDFFVDPPKNNTVKFNGEPDWSGQSFNYSTYVTKLSRHANNRSKRIDSTAGFYYYNSHFLAFQVSGKSLTVGEIN